MSLAIYGLAAQVLAIKLDQVEGVEEHAPVISSAIHTFYCGGP
jgi:hypothetical protein